MLRLRLFLQVTIYLFFRFVLLKRDIFTICLPLFFILYKLYLCTQDLDHYIITKGIKDWYCWLIICKVVSLKKESLILWTALNACSTMPKYTVCFVNFFEKAYSTIQKDLVKFPCCWFCWYCLQLQKLCFVFIWHVFHTDLDRC